MNSYTSRISDLTESITDRFTDNSDAEFGRGLGWASIGIGLAELLAPRQVQDLLGLDDTPQRRGTLRVLGVRELCQGVSILTEARPNERCAPASGRASRETWSIPPSSGGRQRRPSAPSASRS